MEEIYTDKDKQILKEKLNCYERKKNRVMLWQLGEVLIFLALILIATSTDMEVLISIKVGILLIHCIYTYGVIKYNSNISNKVSKARLRYWYALGGIKYEEEDN